MEESKIKTNLKQSDAVAAALANIRGSAPPALPPPSFLDITIAASGSSPNSAIPEGRIPFPLLASVNIASAILNLWMSCIWIFDRSILKDPLIGYVPIAYVVTLLVTTVLAYMGLYRAWRIVQSLDGVRSTPERAVGFCFIPLFNFYWMFVAWYGWSLEYNRFVQANPQSGRERVTPGLFLTKCILAFIPVVNIIGEPIVSTIVYHQLCRAINHNRDHR